MLLLAITVFVSAIVQVFCWIAVFAVVLDNLISEDLKFTPDEARLLLYGLFFGWTLPVVVVICVVIFLFKEARLGDLYRVWFKA